MSNDLMINEDGQENTLARQDQSLESAKATGQIQAALVIAKRFPRNELAAYNKIMEACKRPGLAESAMYAYKRGGTLVTGPSIRLAETIGKAWGNLSTWVDEVEQLEGSSKMSAGAWDLESNVQFTRTFVVNHVRDTKQGKVNLTDGRDIYEMTANLGARRQRACILAAIPRDIVEDAVRQCEKTLAGEGGKDALPLVDRIRKMVVAFGEQGVTQEMLEKKMGHKLEAMIGTELVTFIKIFNSIKDGMSKREDWFDFGVVGAKAADDLNAKLNEKLAQEKPAEEPKQSLKERVKGQ